MPRLGDILLKTQHLDERQLQTALQEQRRWGGRLGETLLRMNYVSEPQLLEALTVQLGIPIADVELLDKPEPHATAALPFEAARSLRALALRKREQNKALLVAMVEPQNLTLVDELRKVTGCRIVPQLVGARTFLQLLPKHYGAEEELAEELTPEPTAGEGSFKVLDAQGRTVVRGTAALPDPAPQPDEAVAAPAQIGSAAELLARIEQTQRVEVASLRAMVELLIERGVFSREEYLARVNGGRSAPNDRRRASSNEGRVKP